MTHSTRVLAEHVDQPRSTLKAIIARLHTPKTGRLTGLLKEKGITLSISHRAEDVDEVFGKK